MDERCPFCNGTGGLPPKRAASFEERLEDEVLQRQAIERVFEAISDLKSALGKKRTTYEVLHSMVDDLYRVEGSILRECTKYGDRQLRREMRNDAAS